MYLTPALLIRWARADVIGICEICSEIHLLSYVTAEDTTILTYPLTSLDSLNDILQKHPDVARLFYCPASDRSTFC